MITKNMLFVLEEIGSYSNLEQSGEVPSKSPQFFMGTKQESTFISLNIAN